MCHKVMERKGWASLSESCSLNQISYSFLWWINVGIVLRAVFPGFSGCNRRCFSNESQFVPKVGNTDNLQPQSEPGATARAACPLGRVPSLLPAVAYEPSATTRVSGMQVSPRGVPCANLVCLVSTSDYNCFEHSFAHALWFFLLLISAIASALVEFPETGRHGNAGASDGKGLQMPSWAGAHTPCTGVEGQWGGPGEGEVTWCLLCPAARALLLLCQQSFPVVSIHISKSHIRI